MGRSVKWRARRVGSVWGRTQRGKRMRKLSGLMAPRREKFYSTS